ncbi:hypothetical protein HOY80DRAFT_997694 [Tuber brumale]|nr:hypothetical protein HOY80DRAFT_997694 [Tuber brumale]
MDTASTSDGRTPHEPVSPSGSRYVRPNFFQLFSQQGASPSDPQSVAILPRPGAGSEDSDTQGQIFVADGMPRPAGGVQDAASAQRGWLEAFLRCWFEYLLDVVLSGTRHQNNSENPASTGSEIPIGINAFVGDDNINAGIIEDSGNVIDDCDTDTEGGGEHAEEGSSLQTEPPLVPSTKAIHSVHFLPKLDFSLGTTEMRYMMEHDDEMHMSASKLLYTCPEIKKYKSGME